MKIKIQSESPVVGQEGVVVESIKAADEALRAIALERNPGGGYDKTFFEIDLDGDKYQGRIDVHYINDRQETASGRLGLLEHIRTRVEYLEGENCPGYITAEHKQAARGWLDALEAVA